VVSEATPVMALLQPPTVMAVLVTATHVSLIAMTSRQVGRALLPLGRPFAEVDVLAAVLAEDRGGQRPALLTLGADPEDHPARLQ
jgi:hypothetical protein